MLGVLVLGFGGAGMTGACSSNEPGPLDSCVTPPDMPPETPTECSAPMEDACMRYRIPLFGNPSIDVALRNKYKAAFGDACYMSVVNTFDCFYKKEQMTPKGKACTDAQMIAEVAGAAPFDTGYDCQQVKGTEDWSLQVGSDPANKITIHYQAAPRQTPLVEVDGVPTEVNGPYRNLTEPKTVGPGNDFYCPSGMVAANGDAITQRDRILQVNRKAHDGGKIHSDLAGFK